KKATPLVNTQFQERYGQFSPDGHWIAYASNDSGQEEVYVIPFVADSSLLAEKGVGQVRERTRVSVARGTQPPWGPEGGEFFYLAADGKLMTTTVSTERGQFAVAKSQALFDPLLPGGARRYLYDVSPDGQKFLVNAVDVPASAEPLTLVVNWPALVKK